MSRTIEARGCEACPYRWDDMGGAPLRAIIPPAAEPVCPIPRMRTIIGVFGLNEYPDWCPLDKGPVIVKKA